MKKKICIIIIFSVCLMSLIFPYMESYAADTKVSDKLTDMSAVSEFDSAGGDNGVIKAINSVIGLLQYAGSGIALIVITILGIKYILASPSEKADVKKSIMPILIGCVLLFGGVNLAGILATFTEGLK